MNDIRRTFGTELENELKNAGFDLRGHYPLLKTMFYTLDVDFDQGKVTIYYGPEQEKLATCKLSASEVAEKLDEWNKKIVGPRLDDETFLRTLYNIAKDTGRASIPDIVSAFAERNIYGTKTKKIIRTFLSYDLYRLATRTFDGNEISLVTATRAYTRRKSDFLWVPADLSGKGMYISHIKFRKVHPTIADVRTDIATAMKT
ncbi:MAG: hypothetical protein GWP10_10030 [Nitrospiraceae bacterium]|nr:hypothetical protein [Nitrospiraceae bacterium]